MSVNGDDLIQDAEVDVGEMIERERVSDIQKSKRKVRDDIETVELALSDGVISEKEGDLKVARAVGLHIRELKYPLINTDVGENFWQEEEIGSWRIPKPDAAMLAWRHKVQNNIGRVPPENKRNYNQLPYDYTLKSEAEFQAREYQIEGLKEYLAVDWTTAVQHTAEFHIRFEGTQSVTTTVEHTIPRHLSMEAYSLCNEFLGELGLGLDLDAGRPFANYSET